MPTSGTGALSASHNDATSTDSQCVTQLHAVMTDDVKLRVLPAAICLQTINIAF